MMNAECFVDVCLIVVVYTHASSWWSEFLTFKPKSHCGYWQVCVVRSAHRGPVSAEYNVTGTTYAPEGIIVDSAGLKVCSIPVFFFNKLFQV
jgi:hypothetical protein